MPRPAKTLISGTMAVLPAIALLCAAGTSQAQTPPSEVINNQSQLGDVFSTQVLNVVEVTDGVGAETSATGNNLIGSTEGAVVAHLQPGEQPVGHDDRGEQAQDRAYCPKHPRNTYCEALAEVRLANQQGP